MHGDGGDSEWSGTTPGYGGSNHLPVMNGGDGDSEWPDNGGDSDWPETMPGYGGSNQLPLPGTIFSDFGDSVWSLYMLGDNGDGESNGTKPGDGSKSSFGHVTSPFGHVIMAVALLVTVVIGYLL